MIKSVKALSVKDNVPLELKVQFVEQTSLKKVADELVIPGNSVYNSADTLKSSMSGREAYI